MTQSIDSLDDTTGQRGRARTVKSADIYDYMAESAPLVTAKGLADELGTSHTTVRKRLEELAEHGYIGKRRLHTTTTAYWRPDVLANGA